MSRGVMLLLVQWDWQSASASHACAALPNAMVSATTPAAKPVIKILMVAPLDCDMIQGII